MATAPPVERRVVELTVDHVDALARGVGQAGTLTVRVPFCWPGERVLARVYRVTPTPDGVAGTTEAADESAPAVADADLIEVLTPAPERVAPGCALYGTCGGCQLQHVVPEAQLGWKRAVVRDAVAALDLGDRVAACVPSPRGYGYRSKITPHHERPRPDRPLAIGFLKQGRRHDIADVERCPIATDGINAALPALRASARAAAGGRRRGVSLILRETAADGVVTDPDARITERVGDVAIEFFAREFFQNNPFLLPAMVDHVVTAARATGAPTLVDTYSGSGLFALAAARAFERVLAVEVSPAAIAAARDNAARNGITNATFLAADAARLFAGLDVPGGDAVVIVDPPRKGCDAAFLNQLVAFRPRGIVYVSCNPEILGRDLGHLVAAGFRVDSIQPFDMFPQTRHVETVVVLSAGD